MATRMETDVLLQNAMLGDIGITRGRGEAVLDQIGRSGKMLWKIGGLMWWSDAEGRWNPPPQDDERDVLRIVRRKEVSPDNTAL